MATFSLPPPPEFMQPIQDGNNAFTSIQYDDMNDNNDTHDDIVNKFKNRNGGNNNNNNSSRSNTPAFGQQQPELSEEDQQINEEYFIWKKNTPYLYDVLVSHDLEWPSLTCQFLPHQINTKSHTQHKLLLGTHTSNDEMNQLLLTQIYLPKNNAVIQKDKHYPIKKKEEVLIVANGDEHDNNNNNNTMDITDENKNTSTLKCIKGGYGGVQAMYKAEVKINHPGSINIARYMPQEPLIIATKSGGITTSKKMNTDNNENKKIIIEEEEEQDISTTTTATTDENKVDDDDDVIIDEEHDDNTTTTTTIDPNVYIFHIGKHPSTPIDIHTTRPEMILKGHQSSGYALAWSHITKGMLLSASDDGTICLYQIPVQDIKGGDKETIVVDKPFKRMCNAHNGVINDVQWHSVHPSLFGTVGDDSTINIWNYTMATNITPENNDDEENIDNLKPIIHLENQHNNKEINCIQFNSFNQYIFATGGADNHINIWDIRSCVGTSNKNVMPLHILKNHTDAIYSIRFSPHDEYTLASSGNDRKVIMWDLSQMKNGNDDNDSKHCVRFIHCGHTMGVNDISFNLNDPNVLCSVGEDNVLQIWKEKSNYYMVDIEEEVAEEEEAAVVVVVEEEEEEKENNNADSSNSAVVDVTDENAMIVDDDNDVVVETETNSNVNTTTTNNNSNNNNNGAGMMMMMMGPSETSCTMLFDDDSNANTIA